MTGETPAGASPQAGAQGGTAAAPEVDFLRLLSHELRNYIAPMHNAMHLLRGRSRADATLIPVIELVERQLARLVQVLDLVGEADRARRGELEAAPQPIALRPVVEQALQPLRLLVEQRAHRLEIALPTDLPAVVADPVHLGRALALLLDNAVRHIPPGGRITVDATATADEVVIRIRDNGAGIAPEAYPQLFEFFATRRAPGPGLGLGLPLARALVALQGGRLEIVSPVPRGGTEVRIVLPAGAAEAATMPAPGPRAEPAAGAGLEDAREPSVPAAPKRSRRVLIADDNSAVRTSLADLLHDMGYEVRAAVDGAEAVALAQRWRPEFVLLDVHMPKLNGFDAARQLRAQFPFGSMRLVMMSGDGLDEVIRRGALEAGFDHCVDKGQAVDELTDLLQSPSAPSGSDT